MKRILITGYSGFVGINLTKYFINNFKLIPFNKTFNFNTDIVIHLAGKAHDLINTTTPEDYYLVNTELTKKVFDQLFLVCTHNKFY